MEKRKRDRRSGEDRRKGERRDPNRVEPERQGHRDRRKGFGRRVRNRRSGVDRRSEKTQDQKETEDHGQPYDQTGLFKKVVGRPPAGLPFSPGILVGDIFFLSGAIGYDRESKGLVQGGLEAETRKAIEGLKDILKEAGMSLEDVVKVTVYLSDMADYDPFNRVYAEYFPANPPARQACAVSGLAFGAKVELSFIAVRPVS